MTPVQKRPPRVALPVHGFTPFYFEVDLPDGHDQKRPRKLSYARIPAGDDTSTIRDNARTNALRDIDDLYGHRFKGGDTAPVRIFWPGEETPAFTFTIVASTRIFLTHSEAE